MFKLQKYYIFVEDNINRDFSRAEVPANWLLPYTFPAKQVFLITLIIPAPECNTVKTPAMDIEFRNRLLALFAPLFWSLTGLVIRLLNEVDEW